MTDTSSDKVKCRQVVPEGVKRLWLVILVLAAIFTFAKQHFIEVMLSYES